MIHTGESGGYVYLVGAGPGSPGLLTLRGAECLQRADVVLYDYLVNPRILVHAPAHAERICLGQHARSHVWTQREINDALVRFAREGKRVVRLKGGDPAIFARAAEEIEALDQAGIAWELVPGITAALAAGSFTGIPLTHRGLASAVAFVTGHEDADKTELGLDYRGLGQFPGTLVFYMSVTTAREWSTALIAGGKPAATPAAIIRRCSLPDQRVIRCRLDTVADEMDRPPRVRPPAIVIVGPVAGITATRSWFEQRPLFGRRVLVTRPRDQAGDLCGPLEELGAEVLVQPAIEIAPPENFDLVDAAMGRLSQFDWLVFSSANGVRAFLDRLLATGRDLRALGPLRLAAIGPGTAEELRRYHLQADLIPAEFRAETLAAELAERSRGERLLLLRASRGREVLAETLRATAAAVEQVVVYRSTDPERPDPAIAEQLAAGKIDYVTVTSSAIARSLSRLYGDSLRQTRLVAISPITSATLREVGMEPAAEAREYTMPGVVAAIVERDQAGP